MANASRDDNRIPTLLGVSNIDDDTPINARVDATNKALHVQIVADDVGIGGGVQYTEGDTDASITGTAVMWEDAGNTLTPVNSSKPLPTSQTGALPAGDNNIGNVDIVSLPNEAALSDTYANPSPAPIGAFSMVWDGAQWVRELHAQGDSDNVSATDKGGVANARLYGFDGSAWDRMPGNSTDGITVNLGSNNDVSLNAGTNAIGKLAANSGVDIGDVDVTSIASGTNTIGNVGLIPRTSGGMTIFRSLDIDETEEQIKATAGQVFSISAFNRTAAPLYLKFYNATAANVTVGTTTPVLTFVVPANADSDGAGFIFNNEIGFAFDTAITVACTTGVADNDTGAPGANDCVINVGYA